jgi:hypothetical protein
MVSAALIPLADALPLLLSTSGSLRMRRSAQVWAAAAAAGEGLVARGRLLPTLPPKTETDQIVALTAEQVTLYEAMVRETMQAIATTAGIERAGLVFKLLTGLKQICNHPAQYLKQPRPLLGRSGKLAFGPRHERGLERECERGIRSDLVGRRVGGGA